MAFLPTTLRENKGLSERSSRQHSVRSCGPFPHVSLVVLFRIAVRDNLSLLHKESYRGWYWFQQLNVHTSLAELASQELTLVANRDKAEDLGLGSEAAGFALRPLALPDQVRLDGPWLSRVADGYKSPCSL
jgi:hypothetical protein